MVAAECEDRCQLKEHKGYDTCNRSGDCQMKMDERYALSYQPGEQGHIARLECALEWAAKNFDMLAKMDEKHGRIASAALSRKQAKECRDAVAAK